MWLKVLGLVVVLSGCASGTSRLCGSDWLCEQALMRPEDYKTSSQNPHLQPQQRVTIQEQRYGIPTGRTYTVKR
jgi:hypothetical protein